LGRAEGARTVRGEHRVAAGEKSMWGFADCCKALGFYSLVHVESHWRVFGQRSDLM